MRPYKFIISGGGTGGHIYPAIAIANELKARYPDAQFLFVGASDRMEMEKVPQAGYQIEGLWIAGLQRRLTIDNLLFPIKLLSSLIKAKGILKRFKPDVAVGTGGYASAPLLKMASKKKVPYIIQEQNSHAGITNKWVSGAARLVCTAYPDMERFFPGRPILQAGNPVRQDLLNFASKRQEALAHFGLDPSKKTLMILGGSLGARAINAQIAKSSAQLHAMGLQLLWQCGKFYFEQYKDFEGESTRVRAFLNRMDLAYAAADMVVSRSGALSVSELCLVGKPVVFIPSPNVAEDHQTKNAQAIEKEAAAILIPEGELEARFEPQMEALLKDESLQHTLGTNLKKLAKPHAARDIADAITQILETQKR